MPAPAGTTDAAPYQVAKTAASTPRTPPVVELASQQPSCRTPGLSTQLIHYPTNARVLSDGRGKKTTCNIVQLATIFNLHCVCPIQIYSYSMLFHAIPSPFTTGIRTSTRHSTSHHWLLEVKLQLIEAIGVVYEDSLHLLRKPKPLMIH